MTTSTFLHLNRVSWQFKFQNLNLCFWKLSPSSDEAGVAVWGVLYQSDVTPRVLANFYRWIFPFSKNHHNFRKSPQRSGSRGRPREHVRPSFQGVLPGRGAWRAGGQGGSLELEPGGVQRRWMPAPGVCHFVSGVRHNDGHSKSFSQVGLQWSCQSCSLLVSVGKAKFLVRSPNLCCRADLL